MTRDGARLAESVKRFNTLNYNGFYNVIFGGFDHAPANILVAEGHEKGLKDFYKSSITK